MLGAQIGSFLRVPLKAISYRRDVITLSLQNGRYRARRCSVICKPRLAGVVKAKLALAFVLPLGPTFVWRSTFSSAFNMLAISIGRNVLLVPHIFSFAAGKRGGGVHGGEQSVIASKLG